MIWPDLAKSHQIWSRSHQIWLDLVGFVRISYIAPVGSSGSGFGEGNLPPCLLVLVLENKDPLQIDYSFSAGWNRIDVGWFGQVFRLQSGLDSLNPMLYLASNIAALVCDCRNLLDQQQAIHPSHIFNEANNCVDRLAKMGRHRVIKVEEYDSCPSFFYHCYV